MIVTINRAAWMVALMVGFTVSVRADVWLDKSASSLTVSPGESGTSKFSFTETSGKAETVFGYTSFLSTPPFGLEPGPAGIFSSFNAVSISGLSGGKVIIGTPVVITVDWTIRNTAPAGSGATLTALLIGLPDTKYASTTYHLVSVPEPAQALAGAVLLTGGILWFAGRRRFNKPAA